MKKYVHINQNNSGGYFIEDEELGVGSDLIIECYNEKDLRERFKIIGKKYDDKHGEGAFDEYCSCCGTRWSLCWIKLEDEIPELEKGTFRDGYYIHRLDESVEEVIL
jgi:hypothetical protein